MRVAATELLGLLDDQQRARAVYEFGDDQARRWLEYRPHRRPGTCVAELSIPARKAAHRLLSTALSDHAYAQAMAIIALEETLDRTEGWHRGRHSGDYWVSIFGEPGDDAPWGWRFEGHHLSVSLTLAAGQASPAPVFFGANPARVSYAGRPVSRPLAPEEDLARALLDAMDDTARAAAVVATRSPADIRSGPRSSAALIEPLGVPAGSLGRTARAALSQLTALYLDRVRPGLRTAPAEGELHFAWEGPLTPGTAHYYRIQGDDLLIEYDNTTEDGNHAHTVLRRPRSDFGEDVLGRHLRQEHDPAGSAPVG
jgi:Protein of unknown function (DUF3500)